MNGNRPTVSIAMTTFNGMNYLEEQLNSLYAQDYAPCEIVIGDDGSTDGTYEFLQHQQARSPIPMRIVSNAERLGWRENFMQTAARCSGDLIAFCDQDDVWTPGKLARMSALFDDKAVTLGFHGASFIDAESKTIGNLNADESGHVSVYKPLEIDFWRPVLGFSMVFKRELLNYNEYWKISTDKLTLQERAAHDQWFLFLGSVFGDVVEVSDRLVNYRLHSSNAMGYRSSRRSFKSIIDAIKASKLKVTQRCDAINNRIAILKAMMADGSGDRVRLSAALAAYEQHLEFNRERMKLYSEKRIYKRFAKILSMVRNNRYASQTLPLSNDETRRDYVISFLGVR